MNRLAGRVVIVTGAADGPKAALGSMIACALAGEGAAVVAADRVDCTSVVDRIRAGGGQALAVHVDVSDEVSVAALVAQTVAEFGPPDTLINNAAVGSNIPPVPLDELSLEAWEQVMAVNVRGPFLCARAVAPLMRAQNYGKIINVGSATALEGLPLRLHYVTSKGAIQAMTRALARELGPSGIRVNSVAPGLVLNAAVAESFAGREQVLDAILTARSIPEHLQPDDLLGVVNFIVSHDSDAITGQCIVVDNGGLFL